MSSRHAVKVVSFDATGTLFHVRGSAGEQYARVAAGHGIDIQPDILQNNFIRSYELATVTWPNFGAGAGMDSKEWWWLVVERSFVASVNPAEINFFDETMHKKLMDMFDTVYHDFSDATNWEIYPETVPTLEALREREIPTVIVSDNDERLEQVVESLGLNQLVDAVVVSCKCGSAKPDPRIWHAALEQLAPAKRPESLQSVLHVGDSVKRDLEGPIEAGMQALLLMRSDWVKPKPVAVDQSKVIHSLDEVLEYV